jgi:hypothetical protein
LHYQRRAGSFYFIIITVMIFTLFFVVGEKQKAHAQSSDDVTLTASAGFSGYCTENRWIPVRVTVENKGADLDARIRVAYENGPTGKFSSAADLSLPTTSRKELFLYIYPQGYNQKLSVSLMAGDHALAVTNLKVTCIPTENLMIGLLTDQPSAYDILSETTPLNGFTRVAQLQPADLPDRAQGWEGLDALVIAGVDTGTITDRQHQALGLWLANGGKLLIVGGPKWQATTSGLDEFLPIDLSTTQTITGLSELQNYFKTPDALGGTALLAVGTVRPKAEVLVRQDGIPIIVEKQVGFGTVYYLAADPGLQPLSTWEGMQSVYSHLLGAAPLQPAWTTGAWHPSYSNQALSALPELGLPSALYIFGLLGVYILIIGPLNYFILWRVKRQELAWISIPALVILFTVFAYFSGYFIRGTRPILNRLAVVQAWDGVERAQVRALVGIYSPNRENYTLQSGDAFMPHPADSDNQGVQTNQNWLSLQQGLDILVPDILVESGGVKAAALQGSIPAITLTHDLVISLNSTGSVLSGTITNTGKHTLQDAVLITPHDSKNIGDLAPGAAKQVQTLLNVNSQGSDFYNLQSQSAYSSYLDDSDGKAFRQNALMHAVMIEGYGKGNAGIYLMGWVDEALLPTRLQGKESDSIETTLYVSMLSPIFRMAAEPLKLSPGLFMWESSNPDFVPYSLYPESIPTGGYVLSFRLAAPLRYSAVQSLILSLDGDGIPGDVSAFLWDWQRAEWVPIKIRAWGNIDIPDPSAYVGPGTEIRLKIDAGNSNQNYTEINSSYFTLVVEP